jgi:hypothetical protein
MRHPTDGTLRRLLDEPAGVPDADREHVATCPVCLAGLAAAREDASLVGAALTAPPRVDVETGWQRLTAAAVREELASAPAPAAPTRRRSLLRRPAVAALGVALVLAGASAAAAADWLQIFRTEEITPVAVTESDLVALPDLSAYGEIVVVQEPELRQVADAAAAEAATGLDVPEVAVLPQGVTGEPAYQVGGQMIAEFTFSADQAAQAAAAAGEVLPPAPPGLDGSRFRLQAGPGVAQIWSEARGVPALVVARGVAPTAFSSGVPFEVVRDYLLSLPGIPSEVATQLRAFSGDGTTLPLPIPAEFATSSSADINGQDATVVTARDGLVAAVVWVEDGVVTAVGGTISADEALSVASDLR